MIYCYLEDCNGGFICHKNDLKWFLNQENKPKLCYEGMIKEIEKYFNITVNMDNIMRREINYE